VRIITGTARGRNLKSPKGLRVRPTSDRVRESLFSILGNEVVDVGVMDLFAGTGSLGLEALSRGAQRAIFVEKNPAALKCLKENIVICGFEERSKVVASSVIPFLNTAIVPEETGIIFIDPPYSSHEAIKVLLAFSKHVKSLSGCRIVLEHSPSLPPDPVPEFLEIVDSRNYGDTALTFFEVVEI
jgi:16S rRNA (guanine(966)-N(2))-methyltransferase RsmD